MSGKNRLEEKMKRERQTKVIYLCWDESQTECTKLMSFRLKKRLPKLDLNLPEIEFEEQKTLFC